MRTVTFIGLMFFLVAVTSAQTVLPNWVVDSLIFEAKYSRQCEQVRISQADELQKQGSELLHTQKALELKKLETQMLDSLVLNAKQANEILGKQFNLDRKELKQKVRKRNILIIGETILIVILLL